MPIKKKIIYQPPLCRDLSGTTVSGQQSDVPIQPEGFCILGSAPSAGSCRLGFAPNVGRCSTGGTPVSICLTGSAPN